MQVACGGVAAVLRLETPEPVPLRASVGSTEAAVGSDGREDPSSVGGGGTVPFTRMRPAAGLKALATGLSPDDGVPNGFASRQDAEFFVAWIEQMLRVVDARDRFARAEDRRQVETLFRRAQGEFRRPAEAG
jgi:hypothetical protein